MASGRLILGAALGSCVHVAGIIHFLSIAEDEGYKTKFLGPAVSVDALFDAIYKEKPDIVSISYRLTPSASRSGSSARAIPLKIICGIRTPHLIRRIFLFSTW